MKQVVNLQLKLDPCRTQLMMIITYVISKGALLVRTSRYPERIEQIDLACSNFPELFSNK